MSTTQPRNSDSFIRTWDTYTQTFKKLKSLDVSSIENLTPLRIVLGGNANCEFLIPGLTVRLIDEGFNPTISNTAFDNWIADSFNGCQDADFWVIWLSGMGITKGMTGRFGLEIEALSAAASRLLEQGCSVVLILPEATTVEDDPFSIFAQWRHELIRELRTILPSSVILLSVEHLVMRMGMRQWSAPRYWEQAKIPCHPDAVTSVAIEVAITLARSIRPMVRAVIVDLDDTLWGGLVGEDGPEGLNVDIAGTGRSFLEMQQFLKDLTSRGIPLAVVSKNDPDQASRPFRELSEMILGLDDFVMFDASWNPKFEAIERFAHQLNIGIDSICFIDDSAQERNEALEMLPGLIVPDLPTNPVERVDFLHKSRLFTAPRSTTEDSLRVQFFQREQIPTTGDLSQYLTDLNMVMDVLRIDDTNFERVLVLLNKTNQFNLSLWRPSRRELHNFIGDPNNYFFAFRLTDRLGDAGITAVLLGTKDKAHLSICAWVVSCRVFSRGFEWAMIEHLNSWMTEQDVTEISLDYVEGPRNKMMLEVLREVGVNSSSKDDFKAPLSKQCLRIPTHFIRIKR